MSRCRQLTLLVIALLVAGAAARRVHAQESAESDSDAASKPPKDYEKGDEGSYIRKRMTWFHDQRAYPHKTIPPGVRMRAFKQMQAKEAAEAAARARQPQHPDPNQPANVPIGSWQMIGPQPDDGFGLANSGRVAAAVVDPTNNQTVYVGAAQGGVWKTTDGGTTWTPLTDTQASLAVGSIALDPENHNTIYVGTGEENNSGDSYYGAGILKSTDGGNTWTNYPGPFGGGAYGGARIGGIAVHPTNSNIVLAAVGCCNSTLTSGVYRSTDGGQTWTNTANVNDAQAYNVIFNPTNGNIVYASFDSNGVHSSTDGGQTWVPDNGSGASSLPTGSNTERVALAMDPNNPSTLYAGIGAGGSNFGQLYGLYKTTNAGLTWTQLTNAPNYCSGQCWYDNVIAVAPGNSNVIFAGGAGWGYPVIQSLDGGNTWSVDTGIHPDLHALAFSADGSVVYLGDDGGMYSTTQINVQATNFATLNAGLATIQYYSGPSINPSNANSGYAGTQDNGMHQYSGSLTWNTVDCGDGGTTAIDFVNTNTAYVNCIEISLDKTTNNGVSFTSMTNGINFSDRANWVPPLAMDPNNSQNLYFGTQYVYQTTNGAALWTQISPDLTAGGSLVAIAVSPVNSNNIITGSTDSQTYVTTNALSGTGATWTNVTVAGSLPPRAITAAAADPHSATTFYLTFSGFSGSAMTWGMYFKPPTPALAGPTSAAICPTSPRTPL